MKGNHKHPGRTNTVIIAISLILLFQNSYAQPGYRPRYKEEPYQQNRSYNRGAQDYRHRSDSWFNPEGDPSIISLGVHLDPIISWFSTDSYDTRNKGFITGFNFGISYNKYFSPNYAISSGINIINAGGRLVSRETTHFELKNYYHETIVVEPGEVITYKISYLSIPVGIKLRSNQTTYGMLFTDIGVDPKIVLAARADIPSANIKGGNAMPEIRPVNLSYHISGGIEYPVSSNNCIVLGIGFEKNLFDITRDRRDQPWDVVIHKLFSFRIGLTF